MGLTARKPVFGVSDKARLKPVSIATETSQKDEILLDMILSNKRITKALIRLRVCAGWSAPLLFATLRRQVFLCQGPYITTQGIFYPSLGVEFQPHSQSKVVTLFSQIHVCFSQLKKVKKKKKKKKSFFFYFFKRSLLLMRNNDPYQNDT